MTKIKIFLLKQLIVTMMVFIAHGRIIIQNALDYNDYGAIVHAYFGDHEVTYEEIPELYINAARDGLKKGSLLSDGYSLEIWYYLTGEDGFFEYDTRNINEF